MALRCVWSRNLENEEAKARYRAVNPQWVVTPGKQTNNIRHSVVNNKTSLITVKWHSRCRSVPDDCSCKAKGHFVETDNCSAGKKLEPLLQGLWDWFLYFTSWVQSVLSRAISLKIIFIIYSHFRNSPFPWIFRQTLSAFLTVCHVPYKHRPLYLPFYQISRVLSPRHTISSSVGEIIEPWELDR